LKASSYYRKQTVTVIAGILQHLSDRQRRGHDKSKIRAPKFSMFAVRRVGDSGVLCSESRVSATASGSSSTWINKLGNESFAEMSVE